MRRPLNLRCQVYCQSPVSQTNHKNVYSLCILVVSNWIFFCENLSIPDAFRPYWVSSGVCRRELGSNSLTVGWSATPLTVQLLPCPSISVCKCVICVLITLMILSFVLFFRSLFPLISWSSLGVTCVYIYWSFLCLSSTWCLLLVSSFYMVSSTSVSFYLVYSTSTFGVYYWMSIYISCWLEYDIYST